MEVGLMVTIACTEEDMEEGMEGCMEAQECMEGERITVVMVVKLEVTEWAWEEWEVLMVIRIRIIHLAPLHPHQAFGCPFFEW